MTVKSFFTADDSTFVNCLPANTCTVVATSLTGVSDEAPITFANPNPSAPALLTQATPETTLGGPLQDTATLAWPVGAPPPTGTVDFFAYGPNDSNCTGAPAFSYTAPLGGTSAVSGPFFTSAVGTYRWVAVYSGDANYASTTSPCNSLGETSVVTRTQASMLTQASPGVSLGGAISDTATVFAAPNLPPPTGTVVFSLYGPNDMFCSGPPIFTSSPQNLSGGIMPTASSGSFIPTAVGTYSWLADYSGDENYLPTTHPCFLPHEQSTVTGPTVTINTQATPTAPLGTTISDTATVSGSGATPTGTVVFTAFGNEFCIGEPAFTSGPRPLTGSPIATASSGPFIPQSVGVYSWVVTYSGDANYAPSTTPCGAVNEQSVVTAPQSDVSIDKSCPPSTVPGGTYSCTLNVLMAGSAATNVVVVDDLGDNVFLVEPPSGGGFACHPQPGNPEIICDRALLTAGNSTITYTVRVLESAAGGSVLTNTATVSSAQDSDSSNNSETVTTQITAPETPVCTITGTGRSETLIGTSGPDVICGLGGDDRLIGRGGADVLIGGRGDDLLEGGDGADTLLGEEGNDRLIGGAGRDSLFGGPGRDRLTGGVRTDSADGGAGSDSCSAETKNSC